MQKKPSQVAQLRFTTTNHQATVEYLNKHQDTITVTHHQRTLHGETETLHLILETNDQGIALIKFAQDLYKLEAEHDGKHLSVVTVNLRQLVSYKFIQAPGVYSYNACQFKEFKDILWVHPSANGETFSADLSSTVSL